MGNQPTQQNFENGLAHASVTTRPDALCGWRRRAGGVGQTTIPQPVWEQMRLAHGVEIGLSQTERLERILETYCKLPLDALKEGVVKIEKRFGIESCRRVLRHLDTGDVESAARLLLTKYLRQVLYPSKDESTGPKSETRPELFIPAETGR